MTVAPTPAPPVVAARCSVCWGASRPVSLVEVADVVAAVSGPEIPVCAECAPMVAKAPAVAAPTTMARCPFCGGETQATAGRVLLGHATAHPTEADRRVACPGGGATVAPHCLV